MKKKIKLSGFELQSGLDRVRAAEGLIVQLPLEHDGRNSWLLNYGVMGEAEQIRKDYHHPLKWDKKTNCLHTTGG